MLFDLEIYCSRLHLVKLKLSNARIDQQQANKTTKNMMSEMKERTK